MCLWVTKSLANVLPMNCGVLSSHVKDTIWVLLTPLFSLSMFYWRMTCYRAAGMFFTWQLWLTAKRFQDTEPTFPPMSKETNSQDTKSASPNAPASDLSSHVIWITFPFLVHLSSPSSSHTAYLSNGNSWAIRCNFCMMSAASFICAE